MLIYLASRFDPQRVYLSARLQSAGANYAVTDLTSSIERVQHYFENILQGEFDYTFVNELGQHLYYGIPEHGARNLLLAVAQEVAQSSRELTFTANNEILSDWFSSSEFAQGLLNDPDQALGIVAAVIGNDSEATSDFAAWLYFYLQRSLVGGQTNSLDVGRLVRSIIDNPEEFSFYLLCAINRLDPTFISLWAEDGSYQRLRTRASSQRQFLNLLSCFVPNRDIRAVRPTRSIDNLRLAARAANGSDNVSTEAMWNAIEQILIDVPPNPSPNFLPRLSTPESVAFQVLTHFQHELPPLEEVARELGTQVIDAQLPSDVLGLFIANADAHHSVILVNRSARNAGSQRFTIAHELGHYLLHNENAFLCGYREVFEHQQALENDANSFAANLLMPVSRFRDLIANRFTNSNVREIARRFDCSNEAAARRLIDVAHTRHLALVVVRNNQVISIAATVITDQGMRWFGRGSAGNQAVPLAEASLLQSQHENNLERYLPNCQSDRLNDLDIDIFPFQDSDGYYLLIERIR